MTLRLAMIQMRVVAGQRSINLDHAAQLVTDATDEGAMVAILPEVMDLGWTHPFSKADVGPVPDGDTCLRLREMARRNAIYLCAGLVEREDRSHFNTAVLIDPGGEVVLRHRKLHELEIAHDLYAQGDQLAVAHTPLGALGVMLCADGFARGQVITRSLGLMGAQVILSPSAWAVPPDYDPVGEPYGRLWRDNFAPPARDFQMWIAGVSSVGPMTAGPWAGWQCIGCSLLVGPNGEPVIQGDYGVQAERILFCDITPWPRPARGHGWERHWAKAGAKRGPKQSHRAG